MLEDIVTPEFAPTEPIIEPVSEPVAPTETPEPTPVEPVAPVDANENV